MGLPVVLKVAPGYRSVKSFHNVNAQCQNKSFFEVLEEAGRMRGERIAFNSVAIKGVTYRS
jgi:hypothetical protein